MSKEKVNYLSTKCEVKTRFKDGSIGWIEKDCKSIYKGQYDEDKIRCLYCKGAVRFHGQKQPHGAQNHVEHKVRQDSENCKAGIYFYNKCKKESEHKLSNLIVK